MGYLLMKKKRFALTCKMAAVLTIIAAFPLGTEALEPGEILHAKFIPGQWECIIFEDGRVESVRIPYHRGIEHTRFFLSAKNLKDLKVLMEREHLAELPGKCGQEDGRAGHRVCMEFKMGNKISTIEAILNAHPEHDPDLLHFIKAWERLRYLWWDLGPKKEVPSKFPRDLSKSKYPSEEVAPDSAH